MPTSRTSARPAPAAGDWGLWVNECGIFASGRGADRWTDFTLRARQERLTMLGMTPGGGVWHVMCGSREDAQEGLETFLEAGFHKAHVKVMRLSACLAKAEARRDLAGAALRAASGGSS